MFGLSLGHLLILLVVVLLFRAKHIPELAENIGKSITLFKRGWRGESLKGSKPHQERLGVREADAVLPKNRGESGSRKS